MPNHSWHYRAIRRLRCDKDKLHLQQWTDPQIVMQPDELDWQYPSVPEDYGPGMDYCALGVGGTVIK